MECLNLENISINFNHKWFIGNKLLSFNYKRNLTSKNNLHFSFTSNICTFKHNHLIKTGVKGQKVASQGGPIWCVMLNFFFRNHLKIWDNWVGKKLSTWTWVCTIFQSSVMTILRQLWNDVGKWMIVHTFWDFPLKKIHSFF